MTDRDGLLMTAAMLMAVSIDGSDEDVLQAARGNYIPLAHKYGEKAEPMFELLKGVRDQTTEDACSMRLSAAVNSELDNKFFDMAKRIIEAEEK